MMLYELGYPLPYFRSARDLYAAVPRPRIHLIRYHGVLAPDAKWRSCIVPAEGVLDRAPESSDGEKKAGHLHPLVAATQARGGLHLENCVKCGGPLGIIMAIEQPEAIHKILTHLKLPPHAPPRAPARHDPWAKADLNTTPATYRFATH